MPQNSKVSIAILFEASARQGSHRPRVVLLTFSTGWDLKKRSIDPKLFQVKRREGDNLIQRNVFKNLLVQNNDNSKSTAVIFRCRISIMTVSCVFSIDGVGAAVKDLEVPRM